MESRFIGTHVSRPEKPRTETADSKSRNRRSQSKEKEGKSETKKKESIMSYLDRVKHEMLAK